MHIEIEKQEKTTRASNTRNGVRHIAEQPALMFKQGETYPDKCTLLLAMSEHENMALNAPALPAGTYDVSDDVYYVDNFGSPAMRIRPEHLKLRDKSLKQAS